MKTGSRYNQLIDYLKGLNYAKYIWKLNELIKDPKLKYLLDESYGGYLSDEKVKFDIKDIATRKLVPCQNEIDMEKSFKYGLTHPEVVANYFKSPVVLNMPLVVYNGNFIIDGHHRWSQVYCFNPDAKMTCWNYDGDFSAMQMLKMMQAAIGSELGEIPVKKVDGINLLTASIDSIKDYIRLTADPKFYEEYSKYAKCDNDPETIINIIAINCASMQSDNNCIKNAPERGLMPQTDKAPEVLENIKEGVVMMSDRSRSFSREMDNIYYELSNLTKVNEDDIFKKITESEFEKFVERLNESYEPGYVELVIDKLFLKPTDTDDIKYMDNIGGSKIDRIYRSTGTERSFILDIINEVKNYLESKSIKVFSKKMHSVPKVLINESNYYVDIDSDRIYVKIGEHDADHEDETYQDYTYYFDKKEWDPSVPELPYKIKKSISNYIKDDSIFSNSKRSFSTKDFAINPKKSDFVKACQDMAKSILGDSYDEEVTKDTAEGIWTKYSEEDFDTKCGIFKKNLTGGHKSKAKEKEESDRRRFFSKVIVMDKLKEFNSIDPVNIPYNKWDDFTEDLITDDNAAMYVLLDTVLFTDKRLTDNEINNMIQSCKGYDESVMIDLIKKVNKFIKSL